MPLEPYPKTLEHDYQLTSFSKAVRTPADREALTETADATAGRS
jgi:hypothetical protein